MQTIKLYPVENFTFGSRDNQDVPISSHFPPSDLPPYGQTRICTDCVILVHKNNHPHVLLLQITASFFKLPGGEGDVSTVMHDCLVPPGQIAEFEHDLLGKWYKHNPENIYPYLPPHITSPREIRRLELIKVPEGFVFAVPKGIKCVAVPLFELYENSSRYGPILSNIPHLLSRFEFEYHPLSAGK